MAWNDRQVSHYYAILKGFPASDEVDEGSDTKAKNRRWRIFENLGVSTCDGPCITHARSCEIPDDKEKAELVVLADVGLGYCSTPNHWPKAVTDDTQNPWVVIKLGGASVADEGNGLWEKLSQRRNKVVAVTTADDLRREKAIEISKGTSWERTARECADVLQNDPRLQKLVQCRYVIVLFDPTGALVFDRDARGSGRYFLFFDPARVEAAPDFWGQGRMWGYTSALTSALAHEIMRAIDGDIEVSSDAIRESVERGLKAARMIYECGFGTLADGDEADLEVLVQSIAYPLQEVSLVVKGQDSDETWTKKRPPHFAKAEVRLSAPLESWTILDDTHGVNLQMLARGIVEKGIESALGGVPRLEYGKVVTVDRTEIESFQSVRSLVRDYAQKKVQRPIAPLSIVVFGAPGSGKSTAVKQVIGELQIPNSKFKFEEFNLSQFRNTSDVIDSFHRLRDDRLNGVIPLVLWDEFDTSFECSLGWLRYFLSPMQDGTFQEGQAIHPIGRSIFAFAGGVSHSLEDFKSHPAYDEAKGPDFLSRVRGTIELRGIDESAGDEHYVVRRAILLRSILEKETQLAQGGRNGPIRIDEGVLTAFLKVSSFNHGARSMRAIVANSSLSGEDYFGRSSLPAETQLNLHVDANEFYTKMRT
ncbi:AAA family ATPase [Streptomyces sp. NPDC005408]|uniref:AAA family ATPase n=1 Tax=Streptomyces sp. NPDC005408 TaxID=3155341 RepID=UPI0033B1FD90